MKILAIDPGTAESGWVMWNGKEILGKGIDSNEEVLSLIKESAVNTVVIEMLQSFGMAIGQTSMETIFWVGRFYQVAESADRVYRKGVKMHLCQSMRAKDSNIRQALIDRFGEPGTKKNPNPVFNDGEKKLKSHLWSAFAIAVTWWDQNVKQEA